MTIVPTETVVGTEEPAADLNIARGAATTGAEEKESVMVNGIPRNTPAALV